MTNSISNLISNLDNLTQIILLLTLRWARRYLLCGWVRGGQLSTINKLSIKSRNTGIHHLLLFFSLLNINIYIINLLLL